MEMDWKVIVSTLVGGLITFAATTGQEMLRARRTRRAALITVGAEIAAALDIVRAREWRSDIVVCLDQAVMGRVHRLSIQMPKDTLTCCRSALAQGSLGYGDLTVLVAKLVMVVDGLKADLDRLFEYDFGDPKCVVSADDPEHAVKLYSEMLGLLDSAESFGMEAVRLAADRLGRDGRGLPKYVDAPSPP